MRPRTSNAERSTVPAASEFGYIHGLADTPGGFVPAYAVAAPLSTVEATDIFVR